MRIVKPSVELIHCTPDPERVIERCGRVCYQSSHKVTEDGASAIDLIGKLIHSGHESVLEHASAGFSIISDRGVTHELVRHRIASFSQESTRYCDYSNDRFGGELQFIEPPGLTAEPCEDAFCGAPLPSLHELWLKGIAMAEQTYKRLRQEGVPPQIARSVLPNSLKSEICMTANFREWRHFLRLRTSPKAHPQMREIAEMIRDRLVVISPACFTEGV